MPATLKVVIEPFENEKLQTNGEKVKSLYHFEQGYAREDKATVVSKLGLVHKHENGCDELGKVRYNVDHAVSHNHIVDSLLEFYSGTQMWIVLVAHAELTLAG